MSADTQRNWDSGIDLPRPELREHWARAGAPVKAPERATDPLGVWSTQIGGEHYTRNKIQPFEYSMQNGLDPMQHTVLKYVTRFREKGGVQDLEKAKHVLDLLIEWESR